MPHVATCRCGAARIEADRLPESVASCNCTWCARRGGPWGCHAPDEVRVVAAPSAVYAPNVPNQHRFRAAGSGMTFNCGPEWTPESAARGGVLEERQLGVNMRMIDEDAVRALPVVEPDGRHGR